MISMQSLTLKGLINKKVFIGKNPKIFNFERVINQIYVKKSQWNQHDYLSQLINHLRASST